MGEGRGRFEPFSSSDTSKHTDFTVRPGEVLFTVTPVAVDDINADAAILTRVERRTTIRNCVSDREKH